MSPQGDFTASVIRVNRSAMDDYEYQVRVTRPKGLDATCAVIEGVGNGEIEGPQIAWKSGTTLEVRFDTGREMPLGKASALPFKVIVVKDAPASSSGKGR